MANQLTLHRYGRYRPTSSDPDSGQISSGDIRAYTPNRLTENVWFTAFGAWMGKQSSNAAVRIAAYDTGGSMQPDDLVGYSDAITVSTIMDYAGAPNGGASYTADCAVSTNAPSDVAWKGFDGQRYALALNVRTAAITHGEIVADDIAADNENFYDATGATTPPDPYPAYSASIEGHMSVWAEGWVNEAPLSPTLIDPSGTETSTTPAFTGTFRDRNGSYGASSGTGIDTGDQVKQYQIQVRAVGSTTLIWNTTYTAGTTEKSTDTISRAYGGSVLTRGVAYEWRMRTSDDYGAFGPFSAWTAFTPVALGIVTLDSTPTGKEEDNTPDFKGRWSHQTAANMTRAQVQILSSSGQVLQTGADYDIADVASSAAPGTLFTVPWANAGLTALQYGISYRYRIRGKDATTWSDWQATGRAFNVNAAPTIPVARAPVSGAIFSGANYPRLEATWSDADDTVATGLTGTFRITRPDLTTVDVTPTYDAGSGRWRAQLTAAEVNQLGTYTWRMAAWDGTIYSGEQAILTSALALSTTWSFVYGAGPTVTITAPTDNQVMTTITPQVAWTATDQVKRRVVFYEQGTTNVVYASPSISTYTTTGVQTHTPPAGYLRNGKAYDVVVAIENSVPLSGQSAPTPFSIAITPPDPVANVQLEAVPFATDPWPTALRVSWDMSTADPGDFSEYTLTRVADGGPDAGTVVLGRFPQTTLSFVDHFVRSGVTYTYAIRVVILVGGLDFVESESTEGSGAVALSGIVLCDTQSPAALRTTLMYRFAGDPLGRSRRRRRPEAVNVPVGGGPPRSTFGAASWWETSIAAVLIDDQWATAIDRIGELEALDAANRTICARDERGRKEFVVIADSGLTIEDIAPRHAKVALDVRSEAYTEGIE